MTTPAERRYRRLLHWYPKRWRREHEEAVLGVMLDTADAEGRHEPTAGERRSAMLHGLGARMDARLAFRAGIAALVLAVLAGVISIWGSPYLAAAGLQWVALALAAGAAPWLVTLGIISLLRVRGVTSDGRALLVVGLAAAGFVLGMLTMLSWSQGFDAANRGVVLTGLAAATLPLAAIGVAVGATATTLVLDALLRRASLRAPGWLALSIPVSVILAVMIGVSAVTPFPTALAAFGVIVVALVPTARTQQTGVRSPAVRHAPASNDPSAAASSPFAGRASGPPASRATTALLSALALVGGTFGVALALTGAHWSPGAVNGTHAMRQGISVLLLSAVPLLAVAGRWLERRSPLSPLHTWGPVSLAVVSCGALGATYLTDWTPQLLWFGVSSLIGGAGIAWLIIPRMRGARAAAVATGASAGLVYAAFVGIAMAPLLVFSVPVLAAVLLFASVHRRRMPALPPQSVIGPGVGLSGGGAATGAPGR